jgi:hypothetical protein
LDKPIIEVTIDTQELVIWLIRGFNWGSYERFIVEGEESSFRMRDSCLGFIVEFEWDPSNSKV